MTDLIPPTTRGVALRVTATLLAMALGVLALFEVKALGAEPVPRPLLPDLQQAVPSQLSVRTDASGATPRFWLGFESAVDNVGEGPLTIVGKRASTGDADMTAEQRVSRSDQSTTTRPGVGTLRFVTSPDHRHWHLLAFDRYELRRADGSLFGPDQKTGFCLGDRRSTPGGSNLPAKPPNKVYTDDCGLDKPELLTVTEGISVGYGDPYGAYLEGQQIEVTGAPAGRYVLVHRVNSDGSLEERDPGNNASSLLIELAWPDGPDRKPTFTVLRTCPGTDRCPAGDEPPPPPNAEPPRSADGPSSEDDDRPSSQNAERPDNPSDGRPEPGVDPLGLRFLRLSPVAFEAARSWTNVSYAVSQAATVRFTIERAVRGRWEGRRCVAQRRENRRAGACTRYVLVGSFSRPAAAGASGFRFRGRLGRHWLAPGAYRLAAVATTAAGARSAPARASFRLLP